MAARREAGATRGSCHRLPWALLGTQPLGRDWGGGGPGVPPAQKAQDTRGHIQYKWLSWAVPHGICPAAAPCLQNKVYVVTESSPARGLG